MGRLQRGILFTLLSAGLVAPAAADPILMFLIGIAREMVISHANAPASERVPEQLMPDFTRVYPDPVETDVRGAMSDGHLSTLSAQRKESSSLKRRDEPKNRAVRGAMIGTSPRRLVTIRAAPQQRSKMRVRGKRKRSRRNQDQIA